jgi:putative endonuclease
LTFASPHPHPEERRQARLEGCGWPVTGAYIYILHCADSSYYIGTTRKDLDSRIAEHNAGHFAGYTATRRPVRLVFAQHFDLIVDAVAAERQLKGWSRAKKEALIAGNWNRITLLAQRRRSYSPKTNSFARKVIG